MTRNPFAPLPPERAEELLEELIASLTTLINFYRGMLGEIEEGLYNSEQAERDWTALQYSEEMNPQSILAELMPLEALSADTSDKARK